MNADKVVPVDINEYIAAFPKATQVKLQQIRTIISQHAAGSTETISYQIPTFKLKGNLVHFAGYQKHIGFYPGAAGIKAFQEELSGYKTAKGSVQFPLNEPLPTDLIARIVQFRVKQDLEKAAAKNK
jgi:uncharacterized protein YdhG (YjbR/CyaY superfamily)